MDIDNMTREELLKGLSEYRFVPGHGPNFNKLSDEKLRKHLRIYRMMFDEEFEEGENE